MKILFLTSGTTGIGRLVFSISIYNAFRRRGETVDFTVISNAPAQRAALLDRFGIAHRELPVENHDILLTEKFRYSKLFTAVADINPDILIVDRVWYATLRLIDELSCKKVFITSQVIEKFFSMELPDGTIFFQGDKFHRVIGIEPFPNDLIEEYVNPLIIRNRDEIFSRNEALAGLGVTGEKPVAMVAVNFKKGYLEEFKERYGSLEADHEVIYTTNINGGGIFPMADYYNAIDLVAAPPTYNTFWEARYFNKRALFHPVPVRFCDLEQRVRDLSDYEFDENGADQLAEILLSL